MALKDEKATVEVIIKGQASNASIKEIEAATRALSAQLKRLPVDSKEFVEKTKEFAQVNARLKSIKDEMKGVGDAFHNAKPESFFSKVKEGALSVFGGNLIMRGVQAVVGVFNDAIDINRQFEASLKNLSAITGATGKDLEFYGAKAREMGATVKGGSVAVVEAFKLIGSAKPELLENKEAMALVTEQAILLSKAAGLELPDAATRLTDAMNQFGADASEAGKYVDALAAGAKYGAAEVPEVTEALLKFGVAAKSSNINIYESTAAIELLAEKGLKGAEAGTQLRNVFAKMSATKILPPEAKAELEAAGVNLKLLSDKTIPFQQRMAELAKISGNAAGITKVFGLENKAAGEILVNNIARLDELTGKVQEHGVAEEQARINTDTFDQALVEAKNAYSDLLLEITDGDFGEIIKGFVKGATVALHSIRDLFHGNFVEGAQKEASDAFFKQIGDNAKKMTVEKRQELVKQLADEVRFMNDQLQNNEFLSKSEKESFVKQIAAKSQAAQAIIAIDKKVGDSSKALKEEEGNAVEALDKKTRKALLKAREDFLKSLEELERKYQKRFMSAQQSEEKDLFEKYNKLLAVAKKGSDDELFLRHSLIEELGDIDKKYGEKAISEKDAFIKEYTKTIQTAELNEIDESREKYAKLIENARKYGVDFAELLEQQKKEEEEIRAKYRTKDVTGPSGGGTSKKTNQFLGGPKEEWQTELNEAVGVYDQFASRVNAILDLVKQANNQHAKQEMERNKLEMDGQLKREKRLLDAKVISQAEYDRRVEHLDSDRKDRDIKAKKEAADRNRKIALFQAIISGAASIVKTLAEYSYPYNLIFAALDGVMVGAQIAAIQSTATPAFAKGGFSNNPSGYVDQPTVFTNSASGKPFLAGEAGSEYIVPNWMLQNPMVANTVDMFESIRSGDRGFATGGFSGNTVPVVQPQVGNGHEEALMKVISKLNNSIEAGLGVNYDNFNVISNRIDAAKTAAQVR